MITFPEDYGNEQLAGQEASFDIALKLVESGTLPEVDSDFVKGYGIESGEESELRAKIKESLENELKTQIGNKSKAAVMECVIANHDFELPESLIAQEVEAIIPEAVIEDSTEDKIKSVAYSSLVGLLIEAIKDLKDEVDSIKGQ